MSTGIAKARIEREKRESDRAAGEAAERARIDAQIKADQEKRKSDRLAKEAAEATDRESGDDGTI